MSSAVVDGPGGAVATVYSHLRARLVDGDIPPRTKINIEQVARDLGFSQTPVREALQKLEADQLLDYLPGRGYMTTPVLDLPGLDALFELRFLLEPWAALVVATDRISNPGTRLHEELHSFEQQIAEVSGDLRQVVLAHDSAFHALIFNATGNGVVHQAYSQSQAHMHLFLLAPVDHDGTIALREHALIAQAIEQCDPEAAESAMREHLRGSYIRSASTFGPADGAGIARADLPSTSPRRMLR